MIRNIAYGLLLSMVASSARAEPVCNDQIDFGTPLSRFRYFGGETITDTATGLSWARCPLGYTFVENTDLFQDDACEAGDAAPLTWKEALAAVDALNTSGGYDGFTDWRLPNPKELLSIVEVRCAFPAINVVIFPDTPPMTFWTNTADARNDNGNIATVNFGQGVIGRQHLSGTAHLRLVRGNGPFVAPP